MKKNIDLNKGQFRIIKEKHLYFATKLNNKYLILN